MPKRFRQSEESLALTALLTALVAYGPVSTDLYLPSLPAITDHFGVDVSMGQLTLSIFALGFSLGMLIYGPLSDRYGRRPVLLGGLSVYIVASVLCLIAPTMETLLAGRLLQALGACAGPVIGRAVVRDIYAKETAAQVMSHMASAMALAPALAPILGGWLHATFGWQSNFAVLVLFGTLVVAASWAMLDETNAQPNPDALRAGRMLDNYGHLLRHRLFMGYTLTMATSFAALFSFISGSSFTLIEVLDVTPETFGFAFMSVVAGFITGSWSGARLVKRVGVDRLIGVGVIVTLSAAAAGAGLAWAGVESLWAVLPTSSLMFLGCGLVLPNATAAAIAPFPTMAGAASALLGFIQMGTGAAAGAVVGTLFDGTTRAMPSVQLVLMVAACVAFFGLISRRSRPSIGSAAPDSR